MFENIGMEDGGELNKWQLKIIIIHTILTFEQHFERTSDRQPLKLLDYTWAWST